jgi:hypothetical protein
VSEAETETRRDGELLAFRRAGHALVDGVADHLAALPSRPVWQPVPDGLREQLLDLPLPEDAAALDDLVATALRDVLPHAMGNGHPAFFGWINPPPSLGSIPVWRGATPPPDAREAEDTAEGAGPFDDDDHFEPGPTAPLPPQEDLHFWGIVVGLVAGPLLLLWLVIFRPDVSDWWLLAALGLIVGGFVLLVLRQPHSRDDADTDTGARV